MPIFASSNNDGDVDASSAYPLTIAPQEFSHKESHPPLKPVWPVKKTRFPCQNF